MKPSSLIPQFLGVKFGLCLVATFFAASGSRAASSAQLLGDWQTFGNNPAHTGYFPGTLNGLPFVLKWKALTPNYNISQAVTGGGRVYITTGWYYGSMYLMSFDSETGQSLVTDNLGSWYSINPPTYSDGSIYLERIGSTSGQTLCLNAVTLATNWSGSFTSQGYDYMAPAVANGSVYDGTGYYVQLSGYNRTNGAPRFSVSLIGNGCDNWTPACYSGKVYTWVNGYFSEHDPNTGARNWTLTNASQDEFLYSMNRTLAVADGRAYFTSTTKLMAVDLAQATNLWSVAGSFSGTPAVANGMVYAISNSVVNAYTTNGAFVRRFDTTNRVETLTDQLIVTDDVLIVAGNYGVYIFRISDGTLQQFISSYHSFCGCYYRSRISLANNTLYISSGDTNVYAYSSSNLLQFTITSSGGLYGSPTPNPYGLNYVIAGSTVTNSLGSPIAGPALTQYLVTGWTGTGSVPPSGNTNIVSFFAATNSTLTWNFKTQYFLQTIVNGNGSVDIFNSWQDAGSNVIIHAIPATYYHFVNWSGDVSGTSNPMTVAMNAPRVVTASFSENLVTNGVPEWWLAQNNLPVSDQGALADTDGDGFANWKEYRAGTNPKDPNSYLCLSNSLSPTQLILSWPAAYGRTYRLLGTTNLKAGFSPLATNIYGSPPYTYYYLTLPVHNPSYYLIQVE